MHHLSRSNGGLKTLLNLREACSTTKQWIDDLQEKEASRLFSQGQAYLNMEEEEDVALFLDTPPPHYINSLRLKMSNGRPKQGPMMEQTYDDNWNQLIDFWRPQSRRLECLQICGKGSRFTQSRLIKFMQETKVKSIQFINGSYFVEFNYHDSILMQLETLILDDSVTVPVLHLMERLVSLNVSLRKLQVPLLGDNLREYDSVRKLVDLRQQHLDFELTVLLPGFHWISTHRWHLFV